jgi:hypothetical protein
VRGGFQVVAAVSGWARGGWPAAGIGASTTSVATTAATTIIEPTNLIRIGPPHLPGAA